MFASVLNIAAPGMNLSKSHPVLVLNANAKSVWRELLVQILIPFRLICQVDRVVASLWHFQPFQRGRCRLSQRARFISRNSDAWLASVTH
jgi:hypothetical protein